MPKAALYCRLSVEDKFKTNESESISNQKAILTEYAQKNGFDIYKIYCDEDYSGLDDMRPGFNQMLEDARAMKFSVIICKSQSRFSRSIETTEKYFGRIFPLWGVRFISLIDNVDTDNSVGKRARQINSLVNEWYCEELSESIRAVFKRKMSSGLFIGSYAPYGYLKSPNDKHTLIPDPETAPNAQYIFSLCADGLSCAKIARILTEKKIPTPSMYKKSKGLDINHPPKNGRSKNMGVWHANSVRKILKNPVYIGYMAQGKERRINYKTKKSVAVPSENWYVIPNTHTPIVTEEIFLKVQKLLASRRKN